MIPEPQMLALAESIGFLKKSGDVYILQNSIRLKDICPCPDKYDHTISIEDLRELLSDDTQTGWTIRQVTAALFNGLRWCFDIIRVADREKDFQGLPAYWECTDEGDVPLGILQAGTCNVDALCILAESLWSPATITKLEIADKGPLLDTLLGYNLNCQLPRDSADWKKMSEEEQARNIGGCMPHEDQPESYHPTVESTSDLVQSLSIFYHFYDAIAENVGGLEVRKADIGQAIVSGLEFILRMQLENGGWGIYRYPSAQVEAHQNSSYLTICSFGLAKMCGVLDDCGRDELYPAINHAIARFVEFAKDQEIDLNGVTIWAPGFSSSYNSVHDVLETSTKIYRCLYSITRGMKEYRSTVYPLIEGYIKFVHEHWTPDYKTLARYPFRSPLKDELNDAFNYWEIRLDVLLSINLLDWYNGQFDDPEFTPQLTDQIWENIEATVGAILEEQHAEHGHWNDPDNGRPFVVSSLYAMEVLSGYLQAAHHMTKA